jgi:di/tricarboxylate transporter
MLLASAFLQGLGESIRMTPEAWFTVAVIAGCLFLMATERLPPEMSVLLGLIVLLAAGILTPAQALAGFANEGMITVAAMYIVAAGLRETGAIDLLSRRWLSAPKGIRRSQLRVMLPTIGLSAFINNTPVVATFLPAVLSWARRHNLSPSRLLMPLSFAAILGGTCTLIGTSTNLVVNGLWLSEGGRGLGLFELAWVGLPVALVGVAYILLAGKWLLPDRASTSGAFDNPREYTVEVTVDPAGPLIGRTIIEAGLRHLGRLFLVEIEREGRIIPAVNSEERLLGGDRLVFAGDVAAIVELQRMSGLRPVLDEPATLARNVPERSLVEVVLSPRCPLLGQTLRDSRFHTYYGASVVAVAREGQRVTGGLGDVRLRHADTLLLEARPVWVERHRYSPDFLLVSEVSDSAIPRHERGWLAWLVLAGIIVAATLGLVPIVTAALVGAGLMLLTGCLSLAGARRSLDGTVLLVIAAAFGLGKALQTTGAASTIAGGVLDLAGQHPWLLLILVYAVTSLLTEVITNNAAAVLMFPITIAASESLGVSPIPYIVTLMLAASASFATPIGYQTNLMVSGPGRYRFSDFVRMGLPLNVLIGAVSVLVIPLIWPF